MAAARLLFLPRLLKVAPTALLILLDANRSWRDVVRHDCLSLWLQASFINQVLPQPDGPRLLSWCDFATHFNSPLENHDQSMGAIPCSAGCLGSRFTTSLRSPSTHRHTITLALLRVWFVLCLSSCLDGTRHGGTSRGQLRLTIHFGCVLPLSRQRVYEHLVDGKRRCLHALAASVGTCIRCICTAAQACSKSVKASLA